MKKTLAIVVAVTCTAALCMANVFADLAAARSNQVAVVQMRQTEDQALAVLAVRMGYDPYALTSRTVTVGQRMAAAAIIQAQLAAVTNGTLSLTITTNSTSKAVRP